MNEFSKCLREPVQVMTWDRRMMVWMSPQQINEMFLETCLIGPLAAMFGREFQQYLLTHKKDNKIPCHEMDYSVNSGRTSLSDERISMVKHCEVNKGTNSESLYQSQRTRSPRRPPTPYPRSPTNRYAFEVRESRWPREERDRPPLRDERDRPLTCGDLIRRGRARDYYIRSSDSYGSRDVRDLPDYVGRDRARGSNEQPREPRTYTKRPRSSERRRDR